MNIGAPDSSLYFSGKLLLATPQMTDPRFEKSAILICGHDENGAMGLVINNILVNVGFDSLLKELNIELGEGNESLANIPILNGGPVDQSKGFLLHSAEYERPETVHITDTYALTGTLETLEDIAHGKGPKELLFILGYAGWGNGQLEDELKQNAWFVTDTDTEFIFNTPAPEKWTRGIRNLGFDPAHLSRQGGSA